ncbi:nucleotidyltransferase domain-containing protein [Bacillus sp. DX1.1]|uniref:nucleotidyltransferase domain-containing protein n=1 Tax=unclassified Bacillus (in: firmicutes) TaxID=185979 RepID=UPI002570558F|nr:MULTISPECIES: nucleotidyltransferase domain-containing protein [unclassified Bacillus (in: firmicutes)]MDM5155281.1 nucleotidyltransferase domain-containing protein [Bacillus sp. DX1.1]WJE84097.1 nucleotidyltransferase domain-containing protein [Bacillus sp. DX3.1]
MNGLEAAKKIVTSQFPNCDVALLGGSVARGEDTKTSDLDIVIFGHSLTSCYRESFLAYGWPVEVFVHNFTSYKDFFKSDCERGRPSLPQLVVEGIVLKDTEKIVTDLKKEAQQLLDKGPERWIEEVIKQKRYFITDMLDDFIGATKREEELFIANHLANLLHEFVLRVNGQWVGHSKWFFKTLKKYDEEFAADFVRAFDHFYKTGEKEELIIFVERVLEMYGGRLFEGFSIGK